MLTRSEATYSINTKKPNNGKNTHTHTIYKKGTPNQTHIKAQTHNNTDTH